MRAGLLTLVIALPLVASLVGAEKTVWDGVYTTAQATRGKANDTTYCSIAATWTI